MGECKSPLAAFQIDDPQTALRTNTDLDTKATSCHPTGLNILLGDGSCRMVSYHIDSWAHNPDPSVQIQNRPAPGIWQRLATRADGDGPTGDF